MSALHDAPDRYKCQYCRITSFRASVSPDHLCKECHSRKDHDS